MEDESIQDLLDRAKEMVSNRTMLLTNLRQRFQELDRLIEACKQWKQLVRRAIRALTSGNENQPFLGVLLLIFVEAIDGITNCDISHYRFW